MEIFQLQYASLLASTLNFSRTAEKLYITQPTLSQQIQKLESELGFSIFYRNSKQVSLTYAGERFINQANTVLREYKKLTDEVDHLNRLLGGKVTLGMSYIQRPNCTEAITSFIKEFENIKFNLTETFDPELISMLHEGLIDIALMAIAHNEEREGLNVLALSEEHVSIIVNSSHRLAGKPSVALEEIVNEHLIFSSPRSGLRKLVLNSFEEKGLEPCSIMDFSSTESRIPFLQQNAGISFTMNNDWYKRTGLVTIPIMPMLYRTYALVTPADAKPNLVVDCLRRFLYIRLASQEMLSKRPPNTI